jgi:hypothetical protein
MGGCAARASAVHYFHMMAFDTTPNAPDTDTLRTFGVLLHNKHSVDAGLTKLAKRTQKKGLAPLTWTWGKAYTRREQVPHPQYGLAVEYFAKITRVGLTIIGDAPKFAGWVFQASLTHMDGENIVRSLPNATLPLPIEYRSRGPVCDHCRHNRRRSETYVLRHEDGRLIQVGSTCIGDFLGSDDAGKLAASASLLSAARGLAEGGCEGFGFGSSGDTTLENYLVYVAWCVRIEGWVSRTKARESGTEDLATANRAATLMLDEKARKKANYDPTVEDATTAAAAEAWAEAITDETIAGESGDYLHNLRVIARSGIVGRKSEGLAASMIVAYQRAFAREKARAEQAAKPPSTYVGELKKRETWTATLDFVTGFATQYGYTTVLKFVTAEGNILTWKTSSTNLTRADAGQRYTITGTVKEHKDYKGQKQTILTRCNIVETT